MTQHCAIHRHLILFILITLSTLSSELFAESVNQQYLTLRDSLVFGEPYQDIERKITEQKPEMLSLDISYAANKDSSAFKGVFNDRLHGVPFMVGTSKLGDGLESAKSGFSAFTLWGSLCGETSGSSLDKPYSDFFTAIMLNLMMPRLISDIGYLIQTIDKTETFKVEHAYFGEVLNFVSINYPNVASISSFFPSSFTRYPLLLVAPDSNKSALYVKDILGHRGIDDYASGVWNIDVYTFDAVDTTFFSGSFHWRYMLLAQKALEPIFNPGKNVYYTSIAFKPIKISFFEVDDNTFPILDRATFHLKPFAIASAAAGALSKNQSPMMQALTQSLCGFATDVYENKVSNEFSRRIVVDYLKVPAVDFVVRETRYRGFDHLELGIAPRLFFIKPDVMGYRDFVKSSFGVDHAILHLGDGKTIDLYGGYREIDAIPEAIGGVDLNIASRFMVAVDASAPVDVENKKLVPEQPARCTGKVTISDGQYITLSLLGLADVQNGKANDYLISLSMKAALGNW